MGVKRKKKMSSNCEKAHVPTWEVDLIDLVVNEEVVIEKRRWVQVGEEGVWGGMLLLAPLLSGVDTSVIIHEQLLCILPGHSFCCQLSLTLSDNT